MNGISPSVTNAVISVESNGNVMAVSSDGQDFGLMQIRKKYSKYTKLQLLNGCTNVMAATEILGRLKKKCKDCVDFTYVNMYNLGETGAKKLKYPKKWKYYRKVIAKLEE